MEHGKVFIKKTAVLNGRTSFTKKVFVCAKHGEIDLFLFPNAAEKHANCKQLPTTRTV